MKTLKEQLLWVERFDTVEELLDALQAFRERYNAGGLVQRHDYRTPAASRVWLQAQQQEAA